MERKKLLTVTESSEFECILMVSVSFRLKLIISVFHILILTFTHPKLSICSVCLNKWQGTLQQLGTLIGRG